MALNEFQKQEAQKLFSEGKSTIDVYRHLGAKSAGFKSPLEVTSQESVLSKPSSTRSNFGEVVSDIPQDIGTGIKQLGEGYLDRYARLKETAGAGLRGEQSIVETAAQLSTNIAGGLIADPAYQLLKTGASFLTTPKQETEIGQQVSQSVQDIGNKTGITSWYTNLDERAKRNVNAALDLADVAPVSLLGKAKSLFSKAPEVDATPKLQDALIRAEQGDISDATRIATASLDEATRTNETAKLAKAYQDSLVGDRVKVNRLLQEQANDMSRKGEVFTQDELIQNLANEGVIPDIRGKLADFTAEIRNLDKRQNELFKAYEPVLASAKATASIDDFSAYAQRSLGDSPNLRFELDKAEAQLNNIVDNLRRSYGLDETGKLTASQIDDISRLANARTKAYRDGGDTFQADVYSELGRAARQWLNDNIPDESFKQVNQEWLRIENIKRTAEAMQNQQVDVGLLGRALGSYVTTLTGVTLGASMGNPFTSVAAGILTKMGGDAIADALRSTKFSPEIRTKLQERLTNDKALIEKLKETATTQENKNMFDAFARMLPAPKDGAYRSEVSSGAPVIASETGASAPKGQVVETAKPGAIKQPERGDKAPDVIKEQQDIEQGAKEEVRSLMEGRSTSAGSGLARTQEDGYKHFSDYPSWMDEDLRKKELVEAVWTHIDNDTVPKDMAGPTGRLYAQTKAKISQREVDLHAQKESWLTKSGLPMSIDDIPFDVVLAVGASSAAYYYLGDEMPVPAIGVVGMMAYTPALRIKLINKQIAKIQMAEEKLIRGGATRNHPAVKSLLEAEKKLIKERANIPTIGMTTRDVSKDVGFKSGGTPQPTIKTKREVTGKTVSGEKFTVPAGAVVESSIDGAKVNITVDGKSYTIPKNQYQNLVGQSDVAKASPFAPELEGTVETVKGSKYDKLNRAYTEYQDELRKKYGINQYQNIPATPKETAKLRELSGAINTSDSKTKYSQYTLDGGENYREILIQAPVEKGKISGAKQALNELEKDGITLESDMDGGSYPIRDGEMVEYDELTKRQRDLLDTVTRNAETSSDVERNVNSNATYQSSHWSEPNVISHIRMNERVVDGKKYAFMEELQSDWARDARKASDEVTKELEMYKRDLRLLEESSGVVNKEAKIKALKEKIADMASDEPKTPTNPLLKNWQIPTVKRALMEAVDSGADRFAWINGEQTSARYNLATHVEEVNWKPVKREYGQDSFKEIALSPKQGGGPITIRVENDGIIMYASKGDWQNKKLDEVLGKGLADKIMEKETGTLSGDGLSFGGEWAKNLYDRQVRDIVKKLTGADVKTVDMGLGDGTKRADGSASQDLVDLISDEIFEGLDVSDIDHGTRISRVTKTQAKQWLEEFKNEPEKLKIAKELYNRTVDDAGMTQQYIDLTPEVKAKIQSKAPSFKMKDSLAAYGVPLLLLMLQEKET